MRRISRGIAWFILPAIAMAIAVPSSMYADDIPAATFETSVPTGYSYAPGGLTSYYCVPIDGCESTAAATTYANGNASASGNGYSRGSIPPTSQGATAANFYFSVVGPTGVFVPLIFTASGSTFTGGVEAEADVLFNSPAGEFIACSQVGGVYGCSYPSSFSISTTYDVYSNSIYEVSVGADGIANSGSWVASVDPMIEIDPSFPSASDFTLEFSPNVATTPEPSSLLLLGTFLLGVVGLFRRKLAGLLHAEAGGPALE